MNKVIYVTDQFGGKKLFDKKGLIGKFQDSYNNVIAGSDDGIKRRVGKALWFMTVDEDNKDLIKRIENYPGYGITFKRYDKEPVYHTLNNLRTLQAPNTGIPNDMHKTLLEQEKMKNAELIADSKRYGILFSKICKAGGAYLEGANPELIKEFETLKQKLGISEKSDTT
uniref:Uncharacterized protein n=1 Tax=viral metagenome TaxID=1070528 RepID=A0A6M3XSK4_9ZZZZ